MIEKFVSKFTDKKINFIKQDSKFFMASDKILDIVKKIKLKPSLIGNFLGEVKSDKFYPSLALLDWLSKNSREKVFVNKMGEIDFLYGKNLRKRHITAIGGVVKPGFLKLVQNEHNENLGYGKIAENGGIKNKLDRGDFLRREWSK